MVAISNMGQIQKKLINQNLSDASPNAWEQDSVEIFLDQNNRKTATYEEDDGQYRINYNNVRSFGGHADQDNFTSVTKIIEGGYIVEAAIALDKIVPEKGTVVGFDFQVNNDQDGDGKRDSVVNWADSTGQSYQNTSKFGVLNFVNTSDDDDGIKEPTPNPGSTPVNPVYKDGAIVGAIVSPVNVKRSISNEAWQQALERANADANGKKQIVIEIPAQEGAITYELQLPLLSLTGKESFVLFIKTPNGTIEIPSHMLSSIEFDGSKPVSIRLSKGFVKDLNASVRNMVGDRPIVNVTVLVRDKTIEWDNAKAPVTVSIPYKPTPEELRDPDHIVVWHISADGIVVPVVNGRYDEVNGVVRFQTTHTGTYVIVSVFKTFNDLNSAAWAKKAIEAMDARGIMDETSDAAFNPKVAMKRVDFITLLVRSLELQGTGEGSMFSDIKSSDPHYKELKIAKELGITNGTGNNLFLPDTEITRQDMMVLVMRALEAVGKKLETKGSSEAFSDMPAVAGYAKASTLALISSGIIKGMNGMIAPDRTLTRAEAVYVLYQIWNH